MCPGRQLPGTLIRHARAALPFGVAVIGAAFRAGAVPLAGLARAAVSPSAPALVAAVGVATETATMNGEGLATPAAQDDQSLQAASMGEELDAAARGAILEPSSRASTLNPRVRSANSGPSLAPSTQRGAVSGA